MIGNKTPEIKTCGKIQYFESYKRKDGGILNRKNFQLKTFLNIIKKLLDAQ